MGNGALRLKRGDVSMVGRMQRLRTVGGRRLLALLLVLEKERRRASSIAIESVPDPNASIQ
jgi:hypothetical protein